MRLTQEVFLVGGGSYAFDLSRGVDAHIYVIRGGADELFVIDAGVGYGMEDVLRNMAEDGLDPAQVSHVLLTHYHVDHAGAARKWRDLTGAKIAIAAAAASALRTGDAGRVGLAVAQAAGVYPPDFTLLPCPIDVELEDGQQFDAAGLRIEAIASPGHSDGHMVFLLQGRSRRYLFSGDCVFWGGSIMLQNLPDSRIQDYARTIDRLSQLSFDALLPGHLTISLQNGDRHVQAAARAFRNLGLPPQAV